MINIAEPQTYPAIDREELAARIEAAQATYDSLMRRGIAIEALRTPAHMVAAHIADITGRLRVGLENGHSEQDMAADFVKLAEFEAAAEVWLVRTERHPAPEGEA